jgi:hypothetical protein
MEAIDTHPGSGNPEHDFDCHIETLQPIPQCRWTPVQFVFEVLKVSPGAEVVYHGISECDARTKSLQVVQRKPGEEGLRYDE